MDATHFLGQLTRNGTGWLGNNLSISIEPDPEAYAKIERASHRRPSKLKHIAIAGGGLALLAGAIIADNVIPDQAAVAENAIAGVEEVETDVANDLTDEMVNNSAFVEEPGEPVEFDLEAGVDVEEPVAEPLPVTSEEPPRIIVPPVQTVTSSAPSSNLSED